MARIEAAGVFAQRAGMEAVVGIAEGLDIAVDTEAVGRKPAEGETADTEVEDNNSAEENSFAVDSMPAAGTGTCQQVAWTACIVSRTWSKTALLVFRG
jgi:hypothetical protein